MDDAAWKGDSQGKDGCCLLDQSRVCRAHSHASWALQLSAYKREEWVATCTRLQMRKQRQRSVKRHNQGLKTSVSSPRTSVLDF